MFAEANYLTSELQKLSFQTSLIKIKISDEFGNETKTLNIKKEDLETFREFLNVLENKGMK